MINLQTEFVPGGSRAAFRNQVVVLYIADCSWSGAIVGGGQLGRPRLVDLNQLCCQRIKTIPGDPVSWERCPYQPPGRVCRQRSRVVDGYQLTTAIDPIREIAL